MLIIFGLQVEGRVAKAFGREGPEVSVKVFSEASDQLAEIPQDAFCVFVVRSRYMPRMVECAAAATEGKDHGQLKPFSLLISLLPRDGAAKGDG